MGDVMRTRAARTLVGLLAVALGASSALVLEAAAPASAAGFGSGDIVVVRVGDGSSALSNAATAVFLDEYTPSGTLVQSVALPTSAVGADRRVTMSGTATSEGALALSADGRYLSLAGFDAAVATPSVASTTATVANRVVARVDGNGVVDASTAITDAFSGADIRGAVTDDGSRFWAVGAGGGVRLAALGGAGTTTAINSTGPTNLRTAGISDGQLRVSTGSAYDARGVRRRIGPADHRWPGPDPTRRVFEPVRIRGARPRSRRSGRRQPVRRRRFRHRRRPQVLVRRHGLGAARILPAGRERGARHHRHRHRHRRHALRHDQRNGEPARHGQRLGGVRRADRGNVGHAPERAGQHGVPRRGVRPERRRGRGRRADHRHAAAGRDDHQR